LENPALTAEVREALYELQQYLSDALAPLMVADSVEVLLRQPVQLTAAQIHAWSSAQYRGPGANVPISDYLFHAIKKLHLMGEYELVSKENLNVFIREVAQFVLAYCPVEDRDLLRSNLSRLGEAPSVLSSTVDFLHRQVGSAERPLATAKPVTGGSGGESAGGPSISVPVTADLARGIRGFTLLVERLQRQQPAVSSDPGQQTTPGPAADDDSREIMSQLLTMAAVNSRSGSELDQHLHRLRGLGLQGETRELFRDLGRTLPDWSIAAPQIGEPLMVAPVGPLEAMHRIISLAEDPNEGATRYREMVQAAIEQFNDGSLGRSATMFELAERIIIEKKVDFTVVQSVRQRSHENLDPEMLRKFSETSEKHPLLRKVLNFFTPLTPQGLLAELPTEEKRDRRRLILALLEAHGAAGRTAAFERLEIVAHDPGGDPHRYYARNLLYLLRRIPPAGDTDVKHEVDLVISLISPDAPILLMKELIAYLGQVRHEDAEAALVSLLGSLERTLLRPPKDALYDIQETRQLLDRTVSALARFGTVSSARAVVAHCLRKQSQLGDTMARLTDLGGQDLSGDPETVDRLLKALRAELPIKVLGFTLQRKSESVFYLIESLASTTAPAVRQALEEVVERFPDHDFGRAAAKTLSSTGAQPRQPEAPSASLSGDLELFGLPELLQTLAESNVSGMLTLKDRESETAGILVMEHGKILDAQAGRLRGPEAIYQLFERPSPGTFAFVSRREGASEKEHGAVPHEVVPLVFEAMRRYDEFRQARLLVPDHVTFEVSGIRPSAHPDEKDANLARLVWNKARTGATASDCEIDVPADSFRVRRLLAHWVEQGALQQV
jgi:hypothetical protein